MAFRDKVSQVLGDIQVTKDLLEFIGKLQINKSPDLYDNREKKERTQM